MYTKFGCSFEIYFLLALCAFVHNRNEVLINIRISLVLFFSYSYLIKVMKLGSLDVYFLSILAIHILHQMCH